LLLFKGPTRHHYLVFKEQAFFYLRSFVNSVNIYCSIFDPQGRHVD